MMNSFSHGGNLATGQVPLRGTVIFVQRKPASELAGYSQLSLGDKAFADLSPTRSRRQNLAAALRLSPTLCRSDERHLATRSRRDH